MVHIICVVYLLSLANGLVLLALDGMFPHAAGPGPEAARDSEIEIVPQAGFFERYSMPLLGAGVALMGLLQRWKGHL
jgi:hypothetical protein